MPERRETREVSPTFGPAPCLETVFRLWWQEENLARNELLKWIWESAQVGRVHRAEPWQVENLSLKGIKRRKR